MHPQGTQRGNVSEIIHKKENTVLTVNLYYRCRKIICHSAGKLQITFPNWIVLNVLTFTTVFTKLMGRSHLHQTPYTGLWRNEQNRNGPLGRENLHRDKYRILQSICVKLTFASIFMPRFFGFWSRPVMWEDTDVSEETLLFVESLVLDASVASIWRYASIFGVEAARFSETLVS